MTGPSAEDLLLLAERHHRALACLLRGAEHEDVSAWALTLNYYVLCAYTSSLAASRGLSFVRHLDLRDWINSRDGPTPIARPYRKLEEWSRDARYRGRSFDRAEAERAGEWFLEARDYILGEMRRAGRTKLPILDPLWS